MDLIKKNVNWIGLIGCVIILIGCILPFAKISFLGFTQTITLIKTGALGIIILITTIISGVVITFTKKPKISLITTMITALLIILNISNAKEYSSMIKYGIGLYLVIIGLLITIITPFFISKK